MACEHHSIRIGGDGATECLVCGATAKDWATLMCGPWKPPPPWEVREGGASIFDAPGSTGRAVAYRVIGGEYMVQGTRSASDLRIVAAWASAQEEGDDGG